MTNRREDLATKTFRGYLRVQGLIRNIMEPYFNRFGISGAQWGVLRALYRAQQEGTGGVRLTDLGERLLVKPPCVSVLVDRMQRMGLLARKVSATDLRSREITLTPAGRRLVRRVLRVHAGQIQSLLEGLSSREQAQLRRLLAQMETHLRSLAGNQPARNGKVRAGRHGGGI